MKTTIDYTHLNVDPIGKRQKALNDLVNYLGDTAYEGLVKQMTEQAPKPTKTAARDVRMSLAIFAGVEGYPVIAFLADFWNISDDDVLELYHVTEEEL